MINKSERLEVLIEIINSLITFALGVMRYALGLRRSIRKFALPSSV